MSEMVYTDSALVDAIKNTWKLHRERNGYSGMYYLDLFIQAIWEKKYMEINLAHFNSEILDQLKKLDKTKFNKIFFRSIMEFLSSYCNSAYDAAAQEGLIKWRFV